MAEEKYNPEIHHRRSIRIPEYDYSQEGMYYVTLCSQNRTCLFGEIQDGQMHLNEAGNMVETIWNEMPEKYSGVEIDAFIVMPNHIHGIIVLTGHPRNVGHPRGGAPTISLPDVVHRYKSFTTAKYRTGVEQLNWMPFPGKLWQRNYFEHVIRNENELNRIREYIMFNPLRWEDDEDNPVHIYNRLHP